MDNSTYQYERAVSLVVFGSDLQGVDLSELRIKFAVKRSDTRSPNMADIRVYNLSQATADDLVARLSPKIASDGLTFERGRVILQAGYSSNFGVIFKGNIKQLIIGRESSTDTFLDIIAGDGDSAYNFAVVNSTIAPGATSIDQVNAAITSMTPKGVTEGHIGTMPSESLPRGKVLYGNARNYLSNIAATADKTWSIQDEKVTFVSNTSYLPGEAVLMSSKTGMIGTPQQTSEGINIKCLLNPKLAISGRVKIDNALVEKMKINLQVVGSAANTPPQLRNDGFYYILVVEHQGDTRGVEWYSNLICLSLDPSANPANSVNG